MDPSWQKTNLDATDLLDVGSSEGFMIKVETPNHPSLDPLAENFGWVDGGKSVDIEYKNGYV